MAHTKNTKKIVLLIFAVTVGAVLFITSQQKPVQVAAYEMKKNEGGEVTVSVTPTTLKSGFPASFEIAFETHSVDLAFDVEQIASLQDETGTVYAPHWDGSPPGGHHRKGTLRFTPDLSSPKTITILLKDIADIPTRTFTWEAAP